MCKYCEMISKRRSATDAWYKMQHTRPVYCSEYIFKRHATNTLPFQFAFPTGDAVADFISHLPGTWPVWVNFDRRS